MNVIITGALALNLTLSTVAQTRFDEPVARPLTKDPTAYRCLIGVPFEFAYLIDQEVYFRDDEGGIYGPWLVVDVEAEHHAGYMQHNGLAADVNCPQFIHRRGQIIIERSAH